MENQIVIIQDKKYKYYCNLCNYGAKTNSDWLKHTKSSKHERGGLKIKICPTCNHECFNHWNLKQHYIMNHSTKEDRIKQKYYCSTCDIVFFCKLYLETHNKGKKHNNIIKCVEEVNKINTILEQRNNNIINDLLNYS